MKNLFRSHLFALTIVIALVSSYTVTAQEASLGFSEKSGFVNRDAECNGPGQLKYDDGTFENGYGWNNTVTDGRYVMLFTPTVYPWDFNTFCIALSRLAAGPSSLTFDIVVYDNTGAGGSPGNLVATVPGVVATGIPVWTTLAWYDFPLIGVPPLTSGSYYIGAKWDASTLSGLVAIGADQSTTTTLQPGYNWANAGPWTTMAAGGFPDYRAMGMRTLGSSGPPCPVDPATNPSPANGATNVSINPGNATWTNGVGATQVEVQFGPVGNLSTVYSGALISQLAIPGPLDYSTTYGWRVIGKNDTCQVPGPVWTFTTEANPLLVPAIALCYPLNVDYWTGSTNGTTKTEVSLVKGANTEDGWFMFDISNVNSSGTIIDSIRFHGFVNAANWPYWSATPLPGLNPLTATAAELKAAIQANSATGVAYIFQNETSTFTPGQKMYTMGTNSHTPFLNSLAQGWFAMGMDSRDNSATYFINWDGWNQTNKPYLEVFYQYVIPVELTSFTASASVSSVTLSWSTATETNNSGFQVERSNGSEFQQIGFVSGHGTITEPKSYSFTDAGLTPGTYSYRLKQVDLDGTFEYSNTVEVEVLAPREFTLNQNYPNPFNPSTMITFSLAVDAKVTLKVFDVLGQEVMTLVNQNLSAGAHEYNFDASRLNSGVYFYRIDASGIDGRNFTSVKKMILTK